MNELAWAAGVFEGEGCIRLTTTNGSTYGRLCMNMTDYDVMERFHKIMGGNFRNAGKLPSGKTKWDWDIGQTKLVRLALIKLLPFLGNRRAHKALDVLDHIELND
jgi:hypothetical protein